jgi:hypothetical protein
MAYTSQTFYPWKFESANIPLPKDYWKDTKNQKMYFDWLANELKIQSPEQWQTISPDIVKAKRGKGLLALYNDSLTKGLTYNDDPNWFYSHIYNI